VFFSLQNKTLGKNKIYGIIWDRGRRWENCSELFKASAMFMQMCKCFMKYSAMDSFMRKGLSKFYMSSKSVIIDLLKYKV
jgi:hypothetical protein